MVEYFEGLQAVHLLLLPGWISWACKGWPCGCSLTTILMVKFPVPTSSLKCAMSFAALVGGLMGALRRLKPLALFFVGWCASCNNDSRLRPFPPSLVGWYYGEL